MMTRRVGVSIAFGVAVLVFVCVTPAWGSSAKLELKFGRVPEPLGMEPERGDEIESILVNGTKDRLDICVRARPALTLTSGAQGGPTPSQGPLRGGQCFEKITLLPGATRSYRTHFWGLGSVTPGPAVLKGQLVLRVDNEVSDMVVSAERAVTVGTHP